MMGILELWLPILLPAIAIFIASSIIHVAMKFLHHPDYGGLPEVMRRGSPKPGLYLLP